MLFVAHGAPGTVAEQDVVVFGGVEEAADRAAHVFHVHFTGSQ